MWHLRGYLPADYCPGTVHVDFEVAIHIAVRQVWPEASIFGCRFHLGQSWFRKLQQLGLQSAYRARSSAGSFLRNFFSLSFLHPEEIEDCIHQDFNAIAPDLPRVDEFVEYILEEYVVGGCRFPPSMWAVYDAEQIRTTNACEALNSKLNSMFYHSHPHIFLLIDALLEIQDMSYMKMRSPGNAKTDPKESIIKEYMTRLEQREIDRVTFVHDLSRKFMPKKIK